MNYEDIHKKCKCCSCEGPLNLGPVLVQLPVKAAWLVPTWGNVITGTAGMACAFVCVDCESQIRITDVKYALEFRGDGGVVYHPLQWNGEVCSLSISTSLPDDPDFFTTKE